jgi:hypothetical protein
MKQTTRLHNMAYTSLAAIGLVLMTGGFSHFAVAANATPSEAARPPVEAKKPDYAPYPERQYPYRVYWGVAHVHTGYSFDSGMFGVTTTPDDLFRVATGGTVVLDNGQTFKQDRPLDWVSITDHAEYMGISDEIRAGSPDLLANPQGKRWYEMSKESPQKGVEAAIEAVISMQTGKPVFDASKLVDSAWAHATEAAEKWNQPGVFTTLHGFEWTSAPGGNNLHRTVIFRDGADRVKQVVPFSTFDSQDPADLWKYMDAYAKKTGGQVLAIPHNGNMSNGQMFKTETFGGKPMDKAYAETRASHEPLIEATQIKGDSETHPYLSPNDEFANFEKWWDMNFQKMQPADKSGLHANYVRSALKQGLELDAKLGANPYKAGMIGGNDAHIGVVTTREDNFYGEFANGLPSPDRWKTPLVMKNNDPKKGPLVSVWGEQAAGLGGVWATENTRAGIWDALKRKEVYATTGDRPVVRVFAGWDFVAADASRPEPDFAANGYANGVPMGGDLSMAPAGKKPVFMVYALRDPDGPNLDRIQIIKGWLGKDGKTQERIFDVAVSGGRKIGHDGRCKTPVGSTVDVANATYTNTIGAAYLSAYWKDPTFDAAQRAFYYVRVIQIPSPRWTAYDQKRYGVKMSAEVPMTVTDRAYTSPIWYSPAP